MDYRSRIYERFSGLFINEDGEGEDAEEDSKLAEYFDGAQEGHGRKTIADAERDASADLNKKWGWIGVIYKLTGGDITKTEAVVSKPLLECLVWLSYEKEMK